MRLFIDDERTAPPEYTHHAKTLEMAILMLREAKREGVHLELVSFDYDAHPTQAVTFEKVAHWIRDFDFWPDEIRIHTANYWHGRPWLEAFFEAHAPDHVKIDLTDPWDIDINPDGPKPAWVRALYEANFR